MTVEQTNKGIEVMYAEILFLTNSGTFRDVRRTKLPNSANLIKAKIIFSVNSEKDKEER